MNDFDKWHRQKERGLCLFDVAVFLIVAAFFGWMIWTMIYS